VVTLTERAKSKQSSSQVRKTKQDKNIIKQTKQSKIKQKQTSGNTKITYDKIR
jgi:hypothetical protein